MKKLRLLVACVAFMGMNTAWSQSKLGSISGVIEDANTKETLIGCLVWIDGSSKVSTTGLDGTFRIGDIKAGSHVVNVSYISYQKKQMTVKVMGGQETKIDVTLEPETIQMEQAVVVGRRKTETDATVMQSIKASDVAMNGISSQMITKTQDKDAAEVLKKIPGITITDGRFVVVRGLTERYNSVLLNGASAPSFESESRAFSFDVIPSNMISNIQIVKTPSPENPADFAGAAIRIATKSDAPGNSLKISYTGGYIQNVTGRTLKLDKINGSEWLGMDNGKRELPKDFPTSEKMIDLANSGADESKEKKASEMPQLIYHTNQISNREWVAHKSKALPPQSLSIFGTRNIKLGKVTLGNITAVNYGVSDNKVTSQRQYYNTEQQVYDYRYNDTSFSRQIKTGLIHNWQLILRGGHKIELRNFVNQLGQSKFVTRGGTEFTNNNTVTHYEDFKYENRLIYSGQIAGSHELREGATKIDWLGGYCFTKKNMPDERRFLWEQDTITKKYYFTVKPSPDPFVGSRYYQQLKENMKNAALNVEHRADVLQNGKPWTLKVGVFYESKERDFWLRNLGFTMGGSNPEIDLSAPIDSILNTKNYYDVKSDTSIVKRYRTYPNGKKRLLGIDTTINNKYGIVLKENTFPQDAYKAKTTLAAAYLGLKIPLGRFTAYGGARVEYYTKLIYDFYNPALPDQVKDTMNIASTDLGVFPSINLSYNISKEMLVRLSYGKTTNRPELREVASFSYNNFEDKTFVIGNPKLKPATIQNYDLRWEWYPTETELVSVSVFYKHFNNPIEISFASNKGSGITLVPENTPQAVSQGLELDVRKSLASLEKNNYLWFLKHITLVMNTSLIKSQITTTQETAREKNRPMQGQSPFIVNLGGYFQSAKGTMVSLMYNRIGKRIIFTGNNMAPHYWELPYNSLDMTMSQKVGKHLELKLGVKDLVAGKQRVVLYDGLRDEGKEYNVVTIKRNRMFSAGISLSF